MDTNKMRKSTFVHLLVVSEAIWWALNESREMVSNSTSKRCPGQRRCQESEPSGNACVRTPRHGMGLMAENHEPIEVGSLFLSHPYFFVNYTVHPAIYAILQVAPPPTV